MCGYLSLSKQVFVPPRFVVNMLVIMADQSSGEYRQQPDRNSGGNPIAAAQEFAAYMGSSL